MKTKISAALISLWAFLTPIEVAMILLIAVIFVDTLVKLISLKFIAIREKRAYREVFHSKMLRRGYIFKVAGYAFLAGPLFPLDYYMLTPFVEGAIKAFGYSFTIPTQALFTNGLLIIFCLIELASINENWFDITGNNILKAVWKTVKKIRQSVEGVSDLYKNVKKD
jgi:hypothetical protein